MERRYEVRLERMLAQADVSSELIQGLLKWLEAFAEPFAKSFSSLERRRNAAEYMSRCSSGSCRVTTSRCSTPWHASSTREVVLRSETALVMLLSHFGF